VNETINDIGKCEGNRGMDTKVMKILTWPIGAFVLT
jgi:hypothetical protein